MTIVFQDKIIYLPYLPPFARYEKLDDYAAICRPARWRQENITSMDGTKLAICVGEIGQASTGNLPHASASCQRKRVVICYFQGNGGSTPPRLPLLSNVLNHLHSRVTDSTPYTEFVIIALSYRGYWKSSGRATEIGIQKDSQALLHHVAARYGGESDIDLQVILWGQSIGAGIALSAASTHLRHTSASTRVNGVGVHLNLPLLILETPFTSIKAMLLTLYPQKWLPYQYLWPFLWNHWDSEKELRKLAAVDVQYRPDVLFIGATRDEVVPAGEADRLEAVSKEVGLVTHRRDVIGALHTDATIRVEGRKIVCSSVVDAISER
jgi:pimeloyl-ACP methyl ester carboxylesterase